MAGGNYQGEEDSISAINVTPLVDVVLVLLVIFMVTAPAIAKRGIAFQEPQTVSGTKIKSPLEIQIAEDRKIYVNGEGIDDLDEVRAKVATLRRTHTDLKALITADINVPHGDVMALIDTVKLAGVRRFAFASQRKRPGAAP